jgi:sulfite reductase (ferredoxin)
LYECLRATIAEIGFQGMSINAGKLVAPALQVLLGGGNLEWNGRFSDKVIKIPSRRGPDALRLILNDFEANANGQSFLNIMTLKEKYFYNF